MAFRLLIRELGRRRDTDIAREYGVSHDTVWKERRRRGIPAYPRVLIDVEELGVVTDAEIALEAGISPGAVLNERRRLGVSKCKRVTFRDLVVDELGSQPTRPVDLQERFGWGERQVYRALAELRAAGRIDGQNRRLS